MGRAYYYFTASLPALDYQTAPLLTMEQFLDDCRRLLHEDDYGAMKEILSPDMLAMETENATLKACLTFFRDFNNILTVHRAQRLHKSPLDFVRGEIAPHPELSEVVNQAAKDENLYHAERLIDQARWDFLDRLSVGHYFHFESIVIYGLKLKILERYRSLESSAGQEKYDAIKAMDLSKCVVQQV